MVKVVLDSKPHELVRIECVSPVQFPKFDLGGSLVMCCLIFSRIVLSTSILFCSCSTHNKNQASVYCVAQKGETMSSYYSFFALWANTNL